MDLLYTQEDLGLLVHLPPPPKCRDQNLYHLAQFLWMRLEPRALGVLGNISSIESQAQFQPLRFGFYNKKQDFILIFF